MSSYTVGGWYDGVGGYSFGVAVERTHGGSRAGGPLRGLVAVPHDYF